MRDYNPYDTAAADFMSAGCKRHKRADCLCDVDLRRGRCPEPDLTLERAWNGDDIEGWIAERLRSAERRWLIETFAPGLLPFLEHTFSGRAEVECDKVRMNFDADQFLTFVLAYFGEPTTDTPSGRSDHLKRSRATITAAEAAGITSGTSHELGRAFAVHFGTRDTLLKSYTEYLADRLPDGGTQADIIRYIQRYAPDLKEYTVYRWIWDHRNGGRSARHNRRKAAA